MRCTSDNPEALAIADLATRTGADPAGVEVVERYEVTWRDGSVGSHEPGDVHPSVVDGYRIVLRVSGTEISYHGQTGLPSGMTAGTAEGALDCACGLYLNDPACPEIRLPVCVCQRRPLVAMVT